MPYLARRVVATRVREVLDYDITKEGVFYIVLTLVIGIAALNTGNNLLFLVVAAMLAAVLVSGIASWLNIKNVELEVVLPGQVFAGRHVLARLNLHVRRRFLRSFPQASSLPR